MLVAYAIVVCVAAFLPINAAIFSVNQSGDVGDFTCDATCTLRDAVDDANNVSSNDTIVFIPSLTTITLASEIIIVNNGTLDINGFGANQLTISGNNTSRIFFTDQVVITIKGVTLQNGNGAGANVNGCGGAIFTSYGTLVLNSVVVQNNSAITCNGGGVYINGGIGGNHRFIKSTFTNNTAGNCGAFQNSSLPLFIANSTFSGNHAIGGSGDGGAICNNSITTIRNSTITLNDASDTGGGIYNVGTLNFANTIVAGNNASNHPEIFFHGGIIQAVGGNFVGDSTGDSTNTGNPISYQGTNVFDTPPMLGILTVLNGGTTPTHALLPVSPAIDAGENALAVDPFDGSPLTTDQRGFTRIIDAPLFVPVVDIGAYEYLATTAATISLGGRVLTSAGAGLTNAVVSLVKPSGETIAMRTNSFGYYRFEDLPVGQPYVLSVSSKRFTFQPQVIVPTEDILDLNLWAE